jgi:glucosamine--fructose-6-phosphate aminotransferase (isomerizing)
MCGIVGYIGKKEVVPILINGLKRLEYRGYDSSGLVVLDDEAQVYVKRAVGKVAELERAVGTVNFLKPGLGIAHTRWATHGEPSERNAHPHADGSDSFWVIHNGIIENYRELRTELIATGAAFRSDTDTEILAHLVAKYYNELPASPRRFFEAVRKALQRVRGTYGIAVVSKHEPDKIIAARNSSPLLIGVGDGEHMVASDASAIAHLTKSVIYLDDHEIAEVRRDGFRIETLAGDALTRQPSLLEWDADKLEKLGHEHFMHKEIYEIPEVIENSIRGRLILEEGRAKLGGIEDDKETLRGIERIIIAACGTAGVAGRVAEYMLEEYAGIPTEVEVASEFRYRKPVFTPRTLLLAISQSGETADTLAAVKEAQEKGVPTMGVVNVVGSSIARETDFGIYNHAGPEVSVASTKAFVSQVVVAALFTIFLGRQREMSLTMGKRIGEALQELPDLVRRVLAQEEAIIAIAKKYQDMPAILTLGRKYNAPLATEAAIKLKEICYIPAIDLPAGEMKHGSIALIDKDFPTLVVAPHDSVYEKTQSNIEQVAARKGPLIVITTEGNDEVRQYANDVIFIPKTLEMLTPVLAVIPLYLFAYHIARLKGNEIDKPRNLAKSVTVE